MPKILNKLCIFTDCRNSSERTPDKIFITVPGNRLQRKQWFKAAGKPTDVLPQGKSYYCCEDHFDLEKDAVNWMFYKMMGKRLAIKKNVVPKKSDGREKNSHLTPSERRERDRTLSAFHEMMKAERLKEQIANSCNIMISEQETVFVIEDCDNITTDYSNSSDSLIAVPLETNIDDRLIVDNEPLDDVKIGFSLSSNGFVAMRDISVGTDALKTTEPDTNYEFSTTIKTEIDDDPTNFELQNNELYCRQMLGLPQKERYIIHLLEASLPVPIVNILIVLKKIKTGNDFQQLGYDFGKTEHGASWAFYTSLPIIANRMKEVIFFPKEETTFGDNFENLHSIVDAFETRTELDSVKKFLVSCTLTGYVNFVSESFSSDVTNGEIFEKSGYVDVIPANSVVVVDNGFGRSLLLEKKNIRVVCLSKSLKTQNVQYSKMLLTFRLNSERLFRKIRQFQIFSQHNIIEKELVVHLDDILVIVCGIINLKEP